MRGKERLKMGGKEEKRGACRGESLIICLPISLFRSTTKPLIKEWVEKKSGARKVEVWRWCGDGVDERVMRLRIERTKDGLYRNTTK